MIFFINFEKAFDFLECNFLFKVLEVMNFGPMFRKWIHTLLVTCQTFSSSTEVFDKVAHCQGFFLY